MSKLAGYVVLLSILTLLCALFGLTGETSLVRFLLNPTDYNNTAPFIALGVMLAVFAIATAVSFFVSGSDKLDFVLLANGGMITFFVGLANELLNIFSALAQGSVIMAAILISPLFYVYVMAIIEWWRGTG